MYIARFSFLFHFYRRKKLSDHNSSTIIQQQKAQTCLEIQFSVMCRNLCNKQDVIKKVHAWLDFSVHYKEEKMSCFITVNAFHTWKLNLDSSIMAI